MDNTILGYISSVNTAVWIIPLVIIVYMLIKRKFKFRQLVMGILSYMMLYVVQQLLLTAVSLPFGKLVGDNTVIAVAIYAVVVPPVAVFGTYLLYKRVIEDKGWFGAIGYGLGQSYALIISELGMKLLSNMFMAVMITDGGASGLSGEQLEVYKNAEAMLKSQTGSFYICIGIAAVMIFIFNMVNVLLVRKTEESGKKFSIILSYVLYTLMYTLFTISAYAGMENLIVIILMIGVIAFSVYYLTKSYDAQDTSDEYISRPSPLLGRNTDKRYRKKK